jgi:PAS domain S-box-containing protein
MQDPLNARSRTHERDDGDDQSTLRQEIEQLRQQHEEVRESELRFRQVAQAMPQLVWTSVAGGRADFINDRWQQYTGMSLEAATEGGEWLDAIHPDDRPAMMQRWDQAYRNGAVFEGEARLRRHDGVYRWHLGRAVPIYDDEGRFLKWLGTATDIESQKQAEASLKQLAETLELRVAERTAQLRAAAGELALVEQRERRRLSQTLHDHLQQLLVTARLKVSMARGRLESPDKAERLLAEVDDLVHNTIETSRDLAVDLSPPVLHERGLVDALHWLGRRCARQHGLAIDVQVRLDDTASTMPEALRDFIFHAARELLFNVAKHADSRTAVVELACADAGEIVLAVADDGRGCDVERLTSRGAGGLGLGLSSMRQRAELWGGSLAFRSAPGAGCRVMLRLPVPASRSITAVPPRPSIAAQPRPPLRERSRDDNRIRILLADDHAVLRDGLAGLLRQHGFLVVGEAENGRQAIELAMVLQPDVVLMDVSMPHVNGIDATQAIVERAPEMRVIGLSMHDDINVAKAMRDAGAVTFVTKNSPSEQLIETIRACARSIGDAAEGPGAAAPGAGIG